MSDFWNAWIWLLVVGFLSFICWLLYSNYVDSHDTVDHHRRAETHDGIGESYASIPPWWAVGMWLTIIFAVGYLILYPGMGNYVGLFNWTSDKHLQVEQARTGAVYNTTLSKYSEKSVDELVKDPDALLLGRRIFRNNCAGCHGKNAQGAKYFPSLADNDWLYGNDAEAIKTSIAEGRKGNMPAWGETLDAQQIDDLTRWLASGEKNTGADQAYSTFCAGCHGGDAKGNPWIGAPNLVDNIWLYGESSAEIRHTIQHGRSGEMPAHKNLLSEYKIHLLTAYVLSLQEVDDE